MTTHHMRSSSSSSSSSKEPCPTKPVSEDSSSGTDKNPFGIPRDRVSGILAKVSACETAIHDKAPSTIDVAAAAADAVRLFNEITSLVPGSLLAMPSIKLLPLFSQTLRPLIAPTDTRTKITHVPVIMLAAPRRTVSPKAQKLVALVQESIQGLCCPPPPTPTPAPAPSSGTKATARHYRHLTEPLGVVLFSGDDEDGGAQHTPFNVPDESHDNCLKLVQVMHHVLPEQDQRYRMFGALRFFTGVGLCHDGIWRPRGWLLWRRTAPSNKRAETHILETMPEPCLAYLGLPAQVDPRSSLHASLGDLSSLTLQMRAQLVVKIKRQLQVAV